jgi:hypothetical protein
VYKLIELSLVVGEGLFSKALISLKTRFPDEAAPLVSTQKTIRAR